MGVDIFISWCVGMGDHRDARLSTLLRTKPALRTRTAFRRVSYKRHIDRRVATRIDDGWALAFMTDELIDNRRFRLLTIVDHFSREEFVDRDRPGADWTVKVSASLGRLSATRACLAKSIRKDNGPEFTTKQPDQWACANGITLDSGRLGKPTDMALIDPSMVVCAKNVSMRSGS